MVNHRGMTLVEVLAAVALLGIGAAFLMQSFAATTRALHVAQIQTDAYTFAVSKTEEMKALWRARREAEGEGSFAAHEMRFLWQAAAQPLDAEAAYSPLSLLTFQVEWPTGRGSERYLLRTYLFTPKAPE